MNKFLLTLLAVLLASYAGASWYWPFGDDEKDPPRISELVKKTSETIEEASDLVSDGKISEAVAKYREALVEIARVEAECPDEFKDSALMGTLKTKRAYVEATIDAVLLNQARENAKPVAVSDTTELERRLADERAGVKETKEAKEAKEAKGEGEGHVAKEAKDEGEDEGRVAKPAKAKFKEKAKTTTRPLTPSEAVMKAIAEENYEKAGRLIEEMLTKRPNDATALNLRAAKEAAEGKFREAEKTLDCAIQSNPRDYFAYYNMAELKLRTREDDRDGARRYYETGRALGGPQDAGIEELLK